MARRRGRRKGKRFPKARRAGRAVRRGGRRFGRRAGRRARIGILGKVGVIIAGGVPSAWAVIAALDPWLRTDFAALDISAKLKCSLAFFSNVLTMGFTGIAAIPATALPIVPAGYDVTQAGVKYAWLTTTTSGVTLVVVDALMGRLFAFAGRGASRTKFMGKQLLTG